METGKIVLGAYAQGLDDHYARNWSKPVDVLRWQVGPIQDLPHDFRVLAIERSNEMTAYATRCMSQPEDGYVLERALLAGVPAPAHGEHSLRAEILLTAFAEDVFTAAGTNELSVKGLLPGRKVTERWRTEGWGRRLVAFRVAR